MSTVTVRIIDNIKAEVVATHENIFRVTIGNKCVFLLDEKTGQETFVDLHMKDIQISIA